MARTDHLTYGELYGDDCKPGCEHHYVSRPRKLSKHVKRLRAKANRRRAQPFTRFSGVGWGEQNVDYYWKNH